MGKLHIKFQEILGATMNDTDNKGLPKEWPSSQNFLYYSSYLWDMKEQYA